MTRRGRIDSNHARIVLFWRMIKNRDNTFESNGSQNETGGSMKDGDVLAVLPIGATEQHGPHLPAETDWIIAQSLAERLRTNLGPELRAIFLPVEKVGYSPEHLDFPTTLSMSYQEAVERWASIGDRLANNGIRKLLLLNAHGGNSPILAIVAMELRRRHGMLCVATSWTRFGVPLGLFREKEIAVGIHGGAVETSVMLALRPDLVKTEALAQFPSFQSVLVERFKHLRAYGSHPFGWMVQDLNPAGVVGDAREASAAKGETLLQHCIAELTQLVAEMAQFEIGHFERRP
jgi:creatinine amidohydrolase